MSGARALVAAVPQRVWTAVAGLVLLASVGVALVLGAGLSTWQGGVTHAPQGAARPPGTVVSPPGSAVIVVPTPHGRTGHAPPAAHGPSTTVTLGVVAAPVAPSVARPAAPPVVAPPAAVPTATTTTASPRAAASTASLPHTGPGRAVGTSKHNAGKHGHHGNRGKHLGWTKGQHKGAGHGHARTHDR